MVEPALVQDFHHVLHWRNQSTQWIIIISVYLAVHTHIHTEMMMMIYSETLENSFWKLGLGSRVLSKYPEEEEEEECEGDTLCR
jgi:hypothetical protein